MTKQDGGLLLQQHKRHATVLSALSTLHALCQQVKERQNTARHVHARLNQIFLALTAPENVPEHFDARGVSAFAALLHAFETVLQRHVRLRGNIVKRVLHHRLFSLQVCGLHHHISAFLVEIGVSKENVAFPMEWEARYEACLALDEQTLHTTLRTVLEATTFVTKTYKELSPRQQREMLVDVQYELRQSAGISPILEDCLTRLYQQFVGLFGWDLSDRARRLPAWFIPQCGVDFAPSTDLLAKNKMTFRAEVALDSTHRQTAVMKCLVNTVSEVSHHGEDTTLRLLCEYMNKYGDADHDHLLRVCGANYMAKVPYVLREYAANGTVLGYLERSGARDEAADPRQRAMPWVLLAQACEAMMYLHHCKRIVHGGLRGSNLLVNQQGQAVVADFGLRSLQSKLHGWHKDDPDEYHRWIAPELLRFNREPTGVPPNGITCDIYAFGMCILEVISGEKPWGGVDIKTIEAVKEHSTRLPPQPPSISGDVWRLIQRMCNSDPRKRTALRQVHKSLLSFARPSAQAEHARPFQSAPPQAFEVGVVTQGELHESDLGMTAPHNADQSKEVDDLRQSITEPVRGTLLETADLKPTEPAHSPAVKDTVSKLLQYPSDDEDSVEDLRKTEMRSEPVRGSIIEAKDVPRATQTNRVTHDEPIPVPATNYAQAETVNVDEVVPKNEDNDRLSIYKTSIQPDSDTSVAWTTTAPEQSRQPGTQTDSFISDASTSSELVSDSQLRDAIDHIREITRHFELPDLQAHLQILRAHARDNATRICEWSGVVVLQQLAYTSSDIVVYMMCFVIFMLMASSGVEAVSEDMVEAGVIQTVFDALMEQELNGEEVELCLSLLLELMAHCEQAKRTLSKMSQTVAMLDELPNVHHRLLQEIKSVLAREKQAEGNNLMKEGMYNEAIDKYSEAIAFDRKRGIYYADRSLALCQARRYEEAAADAEKCLRYNPFDVQGYLRYGIAKKHQRQYQDALSALRRARQVDPKCEQVTRVLHEVEQLYELQRAK